MLLFMYQMYRYSIHTCNNTNFSAAYIDDFIFSVLSLSWREIEMPCSRWYVMKKPILYSKKKMFYWCIVKQPLIANDPSIKDSGVTKLCAHMSAINIALDILFITERLWCIRYKLVVEKCSRIQKATNKLFVKLIRFVIAVKFSIQYDFLPSMDSYIKLLLAFLPYQMQTILLPTQTHLFVAKHSCGLEVQSCSWI